MNIYYLDKKYNIDIGFIAKECDKPHNKENSDNHFVLKIEYNSGEYSI